MKLSDIKADDRNANKHSKTGMEMLDKSVKDNGIIEAITISADNVAISGNARKETFGKNIQVGASLTFTSVTDAKKWEKNAAVPNDRFNSLKRLHDAGIRTWASMEPVIFPDQSLEIMEITKDYVDSYKIGKLNHFPKHEQKFNWTSFLNAAIKTMRKNNKLFYIKNDLAKWADEETVLTPNERDMDFLAIKNSRLKELSLF